MHRAKPQIHNFRGAMRSTNSKLKTGRIRRCSDCCEEVLGALGGWAHGLGSWGPAGRADLVGVLLDILDGLGEKWTAEVVCVSKVVHQVYCPVIYSMQ